MAVAEIAGAIKIALEILKSYIDDPKRRLKAIQDYRDALRKYLAEINNEDNMAEIDSIILDFILSLHEL